MVRHEESRQEQGRLSKHFASECHRASLSAYCSYLNKNRHIDVQLDKATRNAIIQEAEDLAYSREVVSILLDVTRTLARQSLLFRGPGDDKVGIINNCPVTRQTRSHPQPVAQYV